MNTSRELGHADASHQDDVTNAGLATSRLHETAKMKTKVEPDANKMSFDNNHQRRRLGRRSQHRSHLAVTTDQVARSRKRWPHLLLLFSYYTLCAFTILSNNGHKHSHSNNKQQAGYQSLIGLAEANQSPQVHQPQASALNSNNLYQAMSQTFQVFNGNDSSQLDANHFKQLELIDGDTLLVGARNVVYNLSLTTLHEQRRLVWTPDEEDLHLCKIKGKTVDQCQNYIRVIKRATPREDTLLVCGTNAFKPKCRQYTIGQSAYELAQDMQGEGVCPYQESHNVTSTWFDGHLYSATVAQFGGTDPLIHRHPLRTEQYNPKQLNSPNFVSSFQYGEHVYFLFREIAIEHINCGKTIYSRIARVCANDSGGTTTRNKERWTSFAKARLNCSIPGDFPFYFDEIQASTHVVKSAYLPSSTTTNPNTASGNTQQAQDLIYAVFTTPVNSIGGSAVCAYRMADVLAAFEGPFKAQADGNSYWLPVPESRVPQPRPGNCAADSRGLPEETANFIKDNPLMDTAIAPIWSQPLITMASINFRFTQIVVDPQVEVQQVLGGSSMRTDVIFVSTDDGRVLKLINTYHLTASHQVHKLLKASSPSPMGQPNGNMGGMMPMASSLSMAPNGAGSNAMPHRAMAQVAASANKPVEPLPDVSANTVVIEELHLFDQRTPITGMLIHQPATNELDPLPAQPKLIVMSSKQIKAIPLSRCERALSCADCLALYDPYCAWDLQQQACLATGRSSVITNRKSAIWDPSATSGATTASQYPTFTPEIYQQYRANGRSSSSLPPPSPMSPTWTPNVYQKQPGFTPNNHTLAWWSSMASCPAHPNTGEPQLPQQVGSPYRSLFASHLQVPSRFDYQSGHHLSRTSLVALPQMTQISSIAPGSTSQPMSGQSGAGLVSRLQQPVSECLTLCGGVYAPPASSSSDSFMQHNPPMSCADYFASASNSLLLQQNGNNQQNLYTSDNLKWAVIICALLSLGLGLVFGFAIGKSTKSKNESSICSSTFDETNLYMASTGSHGCHMTANGLFAPLTSSHHHPNSTVARLTNHPAFMASQPPSQQAPVPPMGSTGGGGNNYSLADNQTPNGHLGVSTQQSQLATGRNQSAALFEATQSLLGVASDHSSGIGSSTYANQHQQQQQLLFHNNNNNHERKPSVRTGALPPIPTGQQPLVLTNQAQTTHLNHSQLTPNSSTASQQTGTGSSSSGSQATLQVNDQHHHTQQQQQQQHNYFLNQHQLNNNNNHQTNNLHQRSFTNSSAGSGKQQTPLLGTKQPPGSTFLQAAHQQQQQQPNNKIYL